MRHREVVEAGYHRQLSELRASRELGEFLSGALPRSGYDRVIGAVVCHHLAEGGRFSFLNAVAAPSVRARLPSVEGVAIDAASVPQSPLVHLAGAANLSWDHLVAVAAAAALRAGKEPILFGSLAELGLAALVRAGLYEFVFHRLAGVLADGLARHRGLPAAALGWFGARGATAAARCEAILAGIDEQVAHYDIEPVDARAIIDLVLRENPGAAVWLGRAGSWLAIPLGEALRSPVEGGPR